MNRRRAPTDLPASVRDRLRGLARKRGVEFQLLLSEFAIERLLYRLGVSAYAERFVLKGATLFKLWSAVQRRATWDLDLLGHGASGVDDVVAVIGDLCRIEAADGIVFDVGTVVGEEMRVPDEYAGVRVRLQAHLATARVPVQVDVGFGDAVVPAPRREVYPALLDHPPPEVLVYPREAVVAEKLEAVVSLGVTTSRMKDLFDLHRLAAEISFDGQRLARAVRATFERRGTPFPEGPPVVLTADFLTGAERTTQWRAFLRRSRLEGPQDVVALADELRAFLLPVIEAAAQEHPLNDAWAAGGPWVHLGEKAES